MSDYLIFTKDREPMYGNYVEAHLLKRGTYAFLLKTQEWFAPRFNLKGEAIDWKIVPALVVPKEHRAYVLLLT